MDLPFVKIFGTFKQWILWVESISEQKAFESVKSPAKKMFWFNRNFLLESINTFSDRLRGTPEFVEDS